VAEPKEHMTITSDASRDPGQVLTSSGATQFFWTWLIVATSVSVTGNITHAVINANQRTVWIAAGAALVPPTVLLAAARHADARQRHYRIGDGEVVGPRSRDDAAGIRPCVRRSAGIGG
jgi:hypothetical protein